MRHALLLCAVLLCAGEPVPPADLGGPAPGWPATWIGQRAPAAELPVAVVFWSVADGADQPALEQAAALVEKHRGKMAVACLADQPGDVASQAAIGSDACHAVVEAALVGRWLGPDAPLPAGALVDREGRLLWRGRLDGLPVAAERLLAGGFDLAQVRQLAGLRAELRKKLDAGEDGPLEEALKLTASILELEPVDEEALRLRLDLCRHLERQDAFRATLTALPLAQVPATLANELAWERATEEDLRWRHLDLALKLARHARAQAPDAAAHADTLARVLYLLGLVDQAIVTQLQAVSLDPESQDLAAALDYYREVQALQAEVRRQVVDPGAGHALPTAPIP